MLIFWIIVFILSLAILVKSADWFVNSAEKIGLAFKISPFIVGVTIVALGTSFPELIISLFAVFKGATEIVVAGALGSNIANILLIVGFSAIVARTLIIKKSLIDLDAPLLAMSTILFIFIMWDREIVFWEGLLLLCAFFIYFLYTIFNKGEEKESEEDAFRVISEEIGEVEVLPSRVERRRSKKKEQEVFCPKLNLKVFFFLIFGMVGLAIGAYFTIESVIKLAELFQIPASFIAIIAVAIGTSLPELVVSVKAALAKKYEIALGNVFGSNIFNILLVVGIPSLIQPLIVDNLTFNIGLSFLVAATLLFIISGISRRIHIWEGMMYILLYFLFIFKLIGA